MDETDLTGTDVTKPPRATDRPAVAIVDREVTNATVGAILRANHHGHHVFLLTDSPVATDRELVQSLDVTVLEASAVESWADPVPDLVRREARQAGYPGVIAQQRVADPVDFTASTERLAEGRDYALEAVERSSISHTPEVLAAIPAYNEADTIGPVVAEASAVADEVLVVDDGSTDQTVERARAAGATVVEHDRNRGYGGALKTIFGEADRCGAQTLVVLDGDGQHTPAEVPDLVETLFQTEADIVIGSRFVDDSNGEVPRYRRVGLRVVNGLTNFSLADSDDEGDISDTQSGFRAYGRDAIRSLAADPTLGDEMGVSTDILHHADKHGYCIAETGISIDYDVESANSHNPVRHGLHLINNLLRIIEHKRPMLALSVPGVVSILMSAGLIYWALSNYLSSGNFSIPLAVMATFFGIVGTFLVMTGIVLHSVNHLYQR